MLPKRPSTRPEDTVVGGGRCLKLVYSTTAHLYQYHGAECSLRQRYVCELQENAATRALRRLHKSLKLDSWDFCGQVDLWTDWIDSAFIVCKTYSIVPVNSQHNSMRCCSEHNLHFTITEGCKKFSTVMLLIPKSFICPLVLDSTAFPQSTYYLWFSSKFRLMTNQYLSAHMNEFFYFHSSISVEVYRRKLKCINMYLQQLWRNKHCVHKTVSWKLFNVI